MIIIVLILVILCYAYAISTLLTSNNSRNVDSKTKLSVDIVKAYYYIKYFKVQWPFANDELFPNCYGDQKLFRKLEELGYIKMYDCYVPIISTKHAKIIKELPAKYKVSVSENHRQLFNNCPLGKWKYIWPWQLKKLRLARQLCMLGLFLNLGNSFHKTSSTSLPKFIFSRIMPEYLNEI